MTTSLITRSRIHYWIMAAILSFYLGWTTKTSGSSESIALAAVTATFKYGLILYAVESVFILFKKSFPGFPKFQIILMGTLILLICPACGYLGATFASMK